MSLRKLSEIKRGGTYTAQRSTLEHLLLLEKSILEEAPKPIHIPSEKVFLAQHLQQYRAQHHINSPFGIEDIQYYLLTTAEQEIPWQNHPLRGLYTSALIEQAEGNEPITIDMLGKEMSFLFNAINTPRHITINNTNGDHVGAEAGSENGTAHLTINNTNGSYTGAFAGNNHGQAHLTINNTNGDWTGAHAGQDGKAILTITNTKGNYTGAWGGNDQGRAYITMVNNQGSSVGENFGWDGEGTIMVAYNCQGTDQCFGHKGILVLHNPKKIPRIERVTREQKTDILTLISQNASPEEIMAYLVKHT